jgi:hypothetical protein
MLTKHGKKMQAFTAKLPQTFGDYKVSYCIHTGSMSYDNDKLERAVYFTPDFNKEGFVALAVMENDTYKEIGDVPYKKLSVREIFEIVKPYLT